MMISTKGRYALRVMAELAQYGAGRYVPLKEIADRQQISEKYLEAILKKLVEAGLVSGQRGKGGGYQLARAPGACTVREILEATEGSLAPVACGELSGGSCSRAQNCVTLPLWKQLDRLIYDFLEGIPLEQLVRQAERHEK